MRSIICASICSALGAIFVLSSPAPLSGGAVGSGGLHHHHHQHQHSLHGMLSEPVHRVELGHSRRRGDVRRRRTSAIDDSELTPLYPGYGTHFSYIWVGTPPQRQSVIIDTGSHYTAFPCTGCQQCGKHTDDYFDPKKSHTSIIPKCGGGSCEISQSYAEGSTWKAYKVTDALHVGGLLTEDVPRGESKRINFTFGCQTYETGLFRTQLADGIMGMAASLDTLPYQLVAGNRATSKVFALCFRVGGGIMTIGGVDRKIHKVPEELNFAKLRPSGSWFGVRVMKLQFQDRDSKALKDITSNAALFDAGKGTIVDSGTTDTYLPASLATPFKNLFKEITGLTYSNSDMTLTAAQLAKVPDIVFTLLDAKDDGSTFTVTMPFSSYMDQISSNKYAFRVYLNEGSGAVLGANFMNNHNVIFDIDGKRVGFAPSSCKYEDFAAKLTVSPSPAPTRAAIITPAKPNGSPPTPATCAVAGVMVPVDECTAVCNAKNASESYSAAGTQKWSDKCFPPTRIEDRPCHLSCSSDNRLIAAPVSLLCPEAPWSECSQQCVQTRTVQVASQPGAACNKRESRQVSRPCYASSCPINDGDYLVFVDLKVVLPISKWSYVISENFFDAVAYMFNISPGDVEVLTDTGSELSLLGAKVQVQIRLRASAFASKKELAAAGEGMVARVKAYTFGDEFIRALNHTSSVSDRLDYSRYGWMNRRHIVVISVIGFPVGGTRDPYTKGGSTGAAASDSSYASGQGTSKFNLILGGIALGAVAVAAILGALYYRLKQEYAALAKDKSVSGSLREMWKKFAPGRRSGGGGKYQPVRTTEMADASSSGSSSGGSGGYSPSGGRSSGLGGGIEADTRLDADDLESIRA